MKIIPGKTLSLILGIVSLAAAPAPVPKLF